MPRLTRPRILDAALTLVRRDGLDALTMRALANELGVTATALYYHYTGRDELLGALVTHSSSRLIATIDTAAPWEDQIIELVTAIVDELTQYPDLAVWIMTTPGATTSGTRNPRGNPADPRDDRHPRQ